MTSQPTSSFASLPGSPPPAQAPSAPVGTASAPEGKGSAGGAIGYAFPLVPLVLAAALELAKPGFLAPLADGRVSLVGLPAGFHAFALVILLTVISIVAARSIRQPALLAVVLVFTTLLSITLVVVAPALVLIAINLKT